MIDGHGDDRWRYGNRVRYNFSTNIHSCFDHSLLMAKIADSNDCITSYPEPEPVSVEAAIAAIHGCREEEVMVTNGATEAIYLLAKQYSESHSAIFSPTFREYQDACLMYGHRVSFIPSLSLIPSECDMVWICNPNNPTGKAVGREMMLKVVSKHKDKCFVIDQAYSDYTLVPMLSATDAVKMGNVMLLGSLTKRFAVPGLRIGYAIGSQELVGSLKRWRMPWSVNGIAIAGALFLLENIDGYKIDAAMLHAEALRIGYELSRVGVTVTPTDCNFLLCELPHGSAAALKEWLIEESGILIRDASNFEGLGLRHFRIAAQSREENDLLIKEIKRWLAS